MDGGQGWMPSSGSIEPFQRLKGTSDTPCREEKKSAEVTEWKLFVMLIIEQSSIPSTWL